MEPHLFRIAPQAGSGESYAHVGEDFFTSYGVNYRFPWRRRNIGSSPATSFYFESALPHSWEKPGRTETLILWVNTPPTF